MQDMALGYLDTQDTFTAIEYLCREADPLAAIKGFAEVVSHLYWKKKQIHNVIVMAQAGIQYGLSAAVLLDGQNDALAAQVRGIAKGLAYDLGSFTWPGWDEPGIILETEHLRFGRDGAKVNLRLAHQLNKGDLPVSRALWLVGAHDMARAAYDDASNHFGEAARFAQAAGSSENVLMNEGYQSLAVLLADPSDAKESEFQAIQTQIASVPDGPFFADQLKTAWQVFAGSATKAFGNA